MVVCAAIGCINASSGKNIASNVSFHCFPKCQDRRNIWIQNLKRFNFTPTKYSRLCSAHFEAEDFIEDGCIKRLKKEAIPTIFCFSNAKGYKKMKKSNEFEVEGEVIYIKEEMDVTNNFFQDKPDQSIVAKSENVSDSKDSEKINIKEEQLNQELNIKEENEICIKEETPDFEPIEVYMNLETMKDEKTLECPIMDVDIKRNTNKNLEEASQYTHSLRRFYTQSHSRDDKRFECNICQKRYISDDLLRRHARTHKKPHECPICHKHLTNTSHMQYHMKSHNGEKSHKCSICQKQFITNTQLKIHMKAHTKELSFECSLCDKKFSYYSSIRYHMKSHSGEKPHECLVCQKKFIDYWGLKSHMRLHTREKSHVCSLCPRKFDNSGDLQSHILKDHTDELPYDCTHCKKRFLTPNQHKTHYLTHKNESSDNIDRLHNSEDNARRDDNTVGKCNNVDQLNNSEGNETKVVIT